MKGLHSANSLTDILKANDYLVINDKNSKCYRFHVQNSEGEPYMLYTYGISLKLINAENRKRIDLADMERFLLDYIELDKSDILPLGVTPDGRYIGKDISYHNKSNDSIFITGQSSKGKTFCASNLMASLAMLCSRLTVFDVSKSFTRAELLRALPAEVIDTLFEFVDVGEGKCEIPINPLYVGDCTGLPEKKRRIGGLIKAAAGKLSKFDPMKRNVYYNKAKTIQYYGLQCATYKSGAMNCTNTKTLSGKVLEQKIIDELNIIVEQYCQADDIRIVDIHSEQLKELEKKLSTFKDKHSFAKERLVKMYKDKLDGAISDEDYALFRKSLSDEEEKLTEQISEVRQQIEDCHKRQENAASRKALIEKYTRFYALDRSIAEEFIDFIEVGAVQENSEREINIHWKF